MSPMNNRLLVPREFSPRVISGLSLWLDASSVSTLYDAVTSGSNVGADGSIARWEDKSGNSRHFTQGTANNRPVRKVAVKNGRDVVRFDGLNDYLQRTGNLISSGPAPAAFFCVVNFASFVGFPELLEIGNLPRTAGTKGYQFLAFNDGGMYAANIGSNNERYTASSTLSTGAWYVASFLLSGSAFSATNPRFFLNGESVASTRGTGTSTPDITNTQGANIGANNSTVASQFLDGDIGELILYESALSDAERMAVETYLQRKWGIE